MRTPKQIGATLVKISIELEQVAEDHQDRADEMPQETDNQCERVALAEERADELWEIFEDLAGLAERLTGERP